MIPDVLTPQQVADREQLSYHAVLRAIDRGDLRAYKRASRLRIDRADYEAWRTAEPAGGERPQRASSAPRRSPRRSSQRGSVDRLVAINGGA